MTTPLAVQLHGRNEAVTADRLGTPRRIAAFGYDGVEPYDVLSDPHGLRADPDEAGLRACSAHAWVTGDQQAEIDGRTALEVLADLLDPAVLLEVDTYWAATGGQYVPELLRRLGDRVRYLHVKDGPLTGTEDDHVAVGSGRMPVPEVLAAAPAAEWHVVELDRSAGDMLDALGDSLAYLSTYQGSEVVG